MGKEGFVPIFRFVIPTVMTVEVEAASPTEAVKVARYIVANAPRNRDPFVEIKAAAPVTGANIARVQQRDKRRACSHCEVRAYPGWGACGGNFFCSPVCHQAAHGHGNIARA